MPHDTHHFEEYSAKREIGEIYASMAIRQFSLSLYALFEPIYYFQYFGQSVTKVLFFYIAIFFVFYLTAPLGARVMTKIGVKHSMLLSVPFLFLYIIGLAFLPSVGPWLLAPIIIVNVLHKNFFWPAFHIDFARFSRKEKRGQQAGTLAFISQVSSVAGPLIGGMIIAFGGFPTLFTVVLALLLASVIPLFLSREIHETYSLSYGQAVKMLYAKQNRKQMLAFAAQGGENKISGIIWPLFLFLVIGEFVIIGTITSAVLFVTAIMAIFIGRLSDKWSKRKMLRIGSILNATAWTFRSLIQTNIQFFALDTYGRVVQRTAYIPFVSIFYDRAQRKGSGVDEFVIFREMSHQIGVVVGLLASIGLFLLTGSLVSAFFLAAAFSIVFILLKP